MQNGIKETVPVEVAEDFEVFSLPAEPQEPPAMAKYLVKLARHNTCAIKQDLVEAASEAAALKEFARRHSADVSGAQVRVAEPEDLVKKVRGGE